MDNLFSNNDFSTKFIPLERTKSLHSNDTLLAIEVSVSLCILLVSFGLSCVKFNNNTNPFQELHVKGYHAHSNCFNIFQ